MPVPSYDCHRIEQTEDRYVGFVLREGDGHAPLETDNAEAGADIFPEMAVFRGTSEAAALDFQALDIAERRYRPGGIGEPVIELPDVVECFGREGDVALDHEPAVRRFSWRARMPAKASSRLMAREGSASMAS